ncbi:MAG: BMP family ABC transporter substrate-binding protein [Termitinemataceae bacterium]|nr:MAG: BMP family ABC transporter substrate-binding protein [Termitinemataceae bacterium]
MEKNGKRMEGFMKKVFRLSLIAVLALSIFAGCAKKSSVLEKPNRENIKVGFIYIGSINDEGYTQAHDKGRMAVEAMDIKTAYVENVPENADCEKAIRDLIDLGCNVIYTNSFGFMDWTLKVAADFPNVYFGHCSGYKRAENVSTYFGRIFEARYLAGIAAGYKTASNKIGYVAAMPIPEVIRGINAFTLGVQSVNPEATVEVIWTNTWYDPSVEKQGALELLNNGCDVIAQHQDTSAPQIAAAEKGAFAIGYNVSTPTAAPAAYLTAPLFHWEVFYTDDVRRVLDGTWESRAYWEGFSNGTVTLDTLTANNDPRASTTIESVQSQIIAGTFSPFKGPIADQNGELKVAEGSSLSDDEIWNLSWFVKGVIGTIPQ